MENCNHKNTWYNGDLGVYVCRDCNRPLIEKMEKKKKKYNIKKLLKYLDIVKLKKDTDILIRQKPDRTEVHLADDEMYCEQVGFFESNLEESDLDKYISLLNVIREEMLCGKDMHSIYNIYICKVPYVKACDESYNEMFEHISEETYEKLYDAGYEVVKRSDY